MEITAIIEEKEYRIIVEALLTAIENQSIASVCDYGCGDGRVLRQLKEKLPAEIKYCGVDFWSDGFSTHAKPENETSISYTDNSDPQFNEFIRKNKFDLVFSSFALHHFNLPIQELKRMESLLAPGGLLVIIDMYRDYTDAESIVDNVVFYNNLMMLKAFKGFYHRIPYTQPETLDLLSALDVDIVNQEVFELDLTREEIAEFKTVIPELREKSAQEEHQEDISQNRHPIFLDVQKNVHQLVASLGKKYDTNPDRLLVTNAKKRF